MKKIFITGSNGFVGRSLVSYLKKNKVELIAGDRNLYGDFATQNDWKKFLTDVEVIVHLAARVHVMRESDADPELLFKKMNVEASVKLAQAAKEMGVKRFIYLSSIKVNGEQTFNRPFTSSDIPSPEDAYGRSKAEAEEQLLKLHEANIFEVVIIRPPLIYGNGVKANFEKLMLMVFRDLPIPFGRVKNKRSLVSVLNLCDLIYITLTHPKAAGEVFLVKDLKDYSLRELIEEIAKIKSKIPHLIPVPVCLMTFGLKIIGKKSFADRMFGNLQIDIEKNRELLGWSPPYNFQETFKN